MGLPFFISPVETIGIEGEHVGAVAARVNIPRTKEHTLNIHVSASHSSVKYRKIRVGTVVDLDQLAVLVPDLALCKRTFSRLVDHALRCFHITALDSGEIVSVRARLIFLRRSIDILLSL